MKKLISGATIVGMLAFAVPVFGAGVGGELIGAAEFLGLDNVGELISGEFYGNTSNPSGNGEGVLPSFSPGPWVCESSSDCSGPTDPGGSMGEWIAPVLSEGEASPDFANSTDPDIDFSAH